MKMIEQSECVYRGFQHDEQWIGIMERVEENKGWIWWSV